MTSNRYELLRLFLPGYVWSVSNLHYYHMYIQATKIGDLFLQQLEDKAVVFIERFHMLQPQINPQPIDPGRLGG